MKGVRDEKAQGRVRGLLNLPARATRGEWVEATDVIREIRSYEFAVPLGLGPGVCDLCAEPILHRRAEAQQGLAA